MSFTLQLKKNCMFRSMRNNHQKWQCCLTHKTLKCIYDDLTGRLGGRAWVCIWERGGIWPLTQSNKCYCIYFLADCLMFFSQRLEASIFFLVGAEEWGGQRSPPLAAQETISPTVGTGSEKAIQGDVAHVVICCYFLNRFRTCRRKQVDVLPWKQMVPPRDSGDIYIHQQMISE